MDLDALGAEVGRALGDGRIGRPVAVRMHAYLTADHGQLLPRSADALDLCQGWLAGKLLRVDSRGSVADGHVTVLAEFAGGETALVNGHLLRDGPARVEFLLIGTLGTLQYDGLPNAWQEPVVAKQARPSPDPVLGAISRALTEGGPIELMSDSP